MATLDLSECRQRFAGVDRAVLATVHATRGVDAVPTVFALDGDVVWTPIDTVKAKRTTDLARLANVADDARVCLLVDHWDDDWTQLWWVRAHGRAHLAAPDELDCARVALAQRYQAYRSPGTIVAALRIDITRWSGWSATPPVTPPSV